MKDKLKSILPWGLTIGAAVSAIIAFFLIFATAVRYDVTILGENDYKGFLVALGYTKGGIEILRTSAGMILAYAFPLLGACTAVIGKDTLIAKAIASALILTGGILLLCAAHLVKANFIGVPSLGVGTIIGGIFALLGGIAECAYCIIDILDKRAAK